MTQLYLRMFEDMYEPSEDLVYLPALNRALYTVEGGVWIEAEDSAQRLNQGAGWVDSQAVTLSANSAASKVWRWEISLEREATQSLRSAPRARTRCLLEQRLDLPDGFDWLMRCDRVAIPAGQVAYTHVHQGPGIRCTLGGSFRVETQGAAHLHGAGEAWFETGVDPVMAFAAPDTLSEFARCLVLPAACKGRSSVRYVQVDDLHKPKPQMYTVFAERLISLPHA